MQKYFIVLLEGQVIKECHTYIYKKIPQNYKY